MPTQEKDKTADEAREAFEEGERERASTGASDAIAKRDVFRKCGFTRIDFEQDPVMEMLDHKRIKEAVWAAAAEDIVAPGDDPEAKQIQRLKLASRLLSEYPAYGTDEWYEMEERERTGWLLAEKQIWKDIEHGPNTTLQRWTNERLEGHVFVKTVDSVLITTDPKVVDQQILLADRDKIEKAALTAGERAGALTNQMPALEKRAQASLKTLSARVGKKAVAGWDAKYRPISNGNQAEGDE